jgi:hypothetical protein
VQKLFDDKGTTFFTKRTNQCLHGNQTLENMACIMVPITKKKIFGLQGIIDACE